MGKRADIIAFFCVTVAGIAGAMQASAAELALPQGAREMRVESEDLGSYALPAGPFDGAALPSVTIEGAITREAWRIDNESITNLQVIAPLRDSLANQGFEIILDCADLSCGGFDFRFATEVMAPPAMFVDLRDFHFLSARREATAVSLLVSGTQTARFVQIIRVGTASARATETRAIAPAPSPVTGTGDLVQTIETMGHIVLDDLNFETGSATLSAGPYASLAALADYLTANPGRRVALVGHTDSVGALEGNIGLSRRRAEAVRARLIESHGVPAAQMEAGGMGYLSPRTTNLTEAGRAQNRRVEAVLTSTE